MNYEEIIDDEFSSALIISSAERLFLTIACFGTLSSKISASVVFLGTTKMFSDGIISVNNTDGSFLVNGPNSKLISENISINGSKINGTFEVIDGKRDISNLEVEDELKLIAQKREDIVLLSGDIGNRMFDDFKEGRGAPGGPNVFCLI